MVEIILIMMIQKIRKINKSSISDFIDIHFQIFKNENHILENKVLFILLIIFYYKDILLATMAFFEDNLYLYGFFLLKL